MEEYYWRQWSRVEWLRAGDANIKFFHLKASHRKKKNFITGLEDSAGSWKTKENEITGIVDDYFRDLFSSSCPGSEVIASVTNVVEPKITSQMNETLCAPFIEDDI